MVDFSEPAERDAQPNKPSAIILVVLNVSFALLMLAILSLIRSFGRRVSALVMRGSFPPMLDAPNALTELRKIREIGIRDSKRVVELWNASISRQLPTLGHEKWIILEQVFIAALDVSDEDLALECLNHLRTQFKKSSRVNRLSGLYLEKKQRFEDAHAVYTQLLNEDPTNILARKRMIAILKAQRKITEAIDNLRQYLNTFMSDFEAWNELADLYLMEGDYKHAAFCMEEMLLSNPHNHLYCQRYAEIKYTEGGTENLELARVYFAQSCQLNPNNLRSLLGLLLTCSALDSQLNKSLDLLALRPTGKDRKPYMSLPSPTSQPTLSPDAFSAAAPTSSGPERNRQLAKWATKQIYRIYQTAVSESLEEQMSHRVPHSTSSGRLKNNHVPIKNHVNSIHSRPATNNQPEELDVHETVSAVHHRTSSMATVDSQ
ncbi:ER membrane protein complex subunit 2-A [Fasciola gigantica]|uniref:ER membrane protein complex subunit 2 n=1 Tax=Fasciola gigantica TaxID=46835 RepID=A0A504YJ59_FASGI|nr:ER membrane protein complex subunit 2-A [Fasciola gigantica]